MNDRFPQYTVDYISGVMSLRKPQIALLKILEKITQAVHPAKDTNLDEALKTVHGLYPICTSLITFQVARFCFSIGPFVRRLKLGDNGIFFYNKRHKMTRKNFMGITTYSSSQSRFHEIFSDRFVLFVVQKEFLRYQLY